jgi:hypothetical protein
VARKLIVEIVGDSRSLERAFARSSKSAKRFQGDMDKTSRKTSRSFLAISRGLLPVGIGVGIVATLKSSTAAAVDLEQQIGKTNIVFAESGKEVEAWSKTLASSFGLSQREALTTASSFGALFAPVGLTGDAAAEISKQLTELGADLASFYNTDVQSALDALRSGLVGESEPLRRYGVRLSETRVQQEALIATGKDNVKNLTELEKTHARLAIIMDDSTLAQGDFGRTSQQAAQQIKTLDANVENLKANLATYAVPVLNTVVEQTNRFFESLKQFGGAKGGPRTTADLMKFLAEQKKLRNLPRFPEPFLERGEITRREAVAARKAKEAAKVTAEAAKKAALAAKEARQARRQRIRQAATAAREEVEARAQFAVEKTEATKTLKDDLAALRSYNALLTKRIKGGHGTLELEREQFHVQQQIADVLKQQADLAKRTKKRLGVDVTRFQKTARGQFVVPGGGGRGLTIAGGVHLHGIQNVSQLENELARRSKQRAHQRRRR